MTTTKPRSLFRLAGSKARLTQKLIPLMPPHTRHVSVFGGSGADIIYKPRSKVEIFNDINTDVVNTFRVLSSDEQRRTLCQQLALTPYSRLQFAECLTVQRSEEQDQVKRAWAFLHCTMSNCNNVDPGICTPGPFGVPKKDGLRSYWHNIGERIESVGRRCRQVIIENLSWEEILARYDGIGTLFYGDHLTSSAPEGRYYKHEMSDEQHVALLNALRLVEGYVMLSG